ncbi:hypothetical protein OIE66_27080 [Nonomuraea sp. NBC_01738]|uniref:hypothetical protein n=1 Tax=Nonomuraea sp. NBC_01738 TaxID=2976003 RepID=UPI002E109100|nr:hypothetical protein OIE66_27080 [Nonomuraea sp. NBC_01738]
MSYYPPPNTPPSTPPQHEPRGKVERLSQWMQTTTGLITAVSTLVVALTGLFTGAYVLFGKDAQQAPAGAGSAAPADSRASQPAAAKQSQGQGGQAVRNATQPGAPITIVLGYEIDLDSRDANWGIGTSVNGRDVHNSSRIDWNRDAAVTSGGPSYDACTRVTGYGTWSQKDRMEPGIEFCARTTEGRYAWVKFVSIADDGPVKLEVVTWEPTGA